MKPMVVAALQGYKVIDVACGSGDAQTLCVTDDDNVWSWGDGDYGKLGRGGSDGCKLPMKIESLAGLGVIKVECGSQFSVALTRSGSVYTWYIFCFYFINFLIKYFSLVLNSNLTHFLNVLFKKGQRGLSSSGSWHR